MEALLDLLNNENDEDYSLRRHAKDSVFSLEGEIAFILDGFVGIDYQSKAWEDESVTAELRTEGQSLGLEGLFIAVDRRFQYYCDTEVTLRVLSKDAFRWRMLNLPPLQQLKVYSDVCRCLSETSINKADTLSMMVTTTPARRAAWVIEQFKARGWTERLPFNAQRLSTLIGLSHTTTIRALNVLKGRGEVLHTKRNGISLPQPTKGVKNA